MAVVVAMFPVVGSAAEPLVFADGRIRCIVETEPKGREPDADFLRMLSLSMKVALQILPPPQEPATLSIRLLAPPGLYQRTLALFKSPPAAMQYEDTIEVRPEGDIVKMAFRLGHEISHWLAARAAPVRPPLWLDEGLAQRMASRAAAAAARTERRALSRLTPEAIADHAMTLDELTSLDVYRDSPEVAAAFYWQAEELVGTLLDRLGKEDFLRYLATLSTPDAPNWQTPLREWWYFNDADFEALERRVMRPPAPPAVPAAAPSLEVP